MPPIALAENSPSCPVNERGEPVLPGPNRTEWRRQLLMLCLMTKILTDSNNLLKPGERAGDVSLHVGISGIQCAS